MKKAVFYAMPIALASALCTTSFAYTVEGTVTSKTDGKAVANASVSLLKEGKSTKTDTSGKFTIHEDEQIDPSIPLSLQGKQGGGYISINRGVLNYSQSSNTPVQVKVFDLVGNLVVNKTLYGSGSLDLSQGISAKGTYFARVRMGSAVQNMKFTANGSYSSASKTTTAALKAAAQGEALQVIAEGFDTLNVPLANLDTTLALELTATSQNLNPGEKTYKFGYALGNAPRPSAGCGKATSLKATKQVENGERFELNVNGENREFFITLPKNYDNSKPYKILFAMHCLGSNAEDFVHHAPDYDHPTPYYGQQNLDKEGNYIFVAPRGDTDGMPWSMTSDKDHKFFDKLLTTMEDNYCIDTSRVFATGFSFGAMYTNSLAWDMQHRLRAVAVYAPVAEVIYLPKNAGKPIAWMAVHGKRDSTCQYSHDLQSTLPAILKNNGKASDGDSQFTDASSEKPEEFNGTAGHLCYDFKTVDPRFPVKFCSWNGEHQWTAHDGGNTGVGQGWENTWVPEEVHKFFEQF